MRIFDCFTFFDELDLLNLRLHELQDVVDVFVLAEATRTYNNRRKNLLFAENKGLFEPFLHRIRHVVVEDMPTKNAHIADAWPREYHQRNALERGLGDVEDNDLVMVSDVDEIPHPEILKMIRDGAIRVDVINFEQRFFYYNLDWVKNGFWYGSVIVDWGLWKAGALEMTRHDVDEGLQLLRDNRMAVDSISPLEALGRAQAPYGDQRCGGWHFSYFGGVDRIQNKIRSFAHQEYNHERFTNRNHLAGAVREGRDPFDRPGEDLVRNQDYVNLPRHVKLIRDRPHSLAGRATPLLIEGEQSRRDATRR